MADDATTEAKPITDEERVQAAADWEAYAAQFGARGAPAVLRAERRAFMGGWLARRHREEPTS
ncbi:hypothetical protein SEA_FUZZBUSTER_58 [Microbacterium phage FuzzBuster]|uniref:Uncharacterized protein n=1 Tax=Microbacterium phage FuzzBuster TaxID=2590935 RepID=A0A516KV39_9CAUD|nr:hypothetical protein SEA_FUZZBUSTER_58 [Microbacterium phage FuzzBuster]